MTEDAQSYSPHISLGIARPKPWRVILGFVIAPTAAAAIPALLSSSLSRAMFYITLVLVAYPATLVVAIPAYYLLRSRARPSLSNVLMVGCGIGLVPSVIFTTVIPLFSDAPRDVFLFFALSLLAGSVGGLTFWLCAMWQPFAFSHRRS